jgi:hypothetical protein
VKVSIYALLHSPYSTYQTGQNNKANGPADLYLFKLEYPKSECFGER